MILTYQKIDPDAKTQWWISPDAFYLQMLDLRSKEVVYLDDYDPLDPHQAVITFHGVYQNVWNYAVPILKHFNYPFELFIIGKYVGKDNQFDTGEPLTNFADAETLSKMVQAGARLQWHPWSQGILSNNISQDDYVRELIVPAELRSLSVEGFKWFSFPHGRNDGWMRTQLQQHFTGALAWEGGDATDRYNLERVPSFEKSRFTDSKVSVIIPCYNYGHLVAEAIESVLNQTYPPDEILFIDDASSDNSVEVARRYEPLIRVEVNPKNLGVVANFRKAVELTQGDYICFLGADNRFRADYVELSKAMLDANPDVGVAYTHFVLFDQRAQVEAIKANAVPHPTVHGFYLKEFPANPQVDINKTNYIHGSSMYRRKAYAQAGGYSEGNLPEDHSLFAHMLNQGWKAKLVDAYSLEYRQHSKDQINQLKSLEIENVYHRAYERLLLNQIAEKDQLILSLTGWAAERSSVQTTEPGQQPSMLAGQYQEITSSKAWRALVLVNRLRVRLLPPASLRLRLARKMISILLFPLSLRQNQQRNQQINLIRASGLFDPDWYLAYNPDVAQAGMDPCLHYLLHGGFEGRNPGTSFSSKSYLERYSDVKAAGLNPLIHYLKWGRSEGRQTK